MNYKSIKVIAFDFDDTLCDRKKSIYYLYGDFLDKYQKLNDSLLKEAILQDMIVHDQYGYVEKDYILKRIEEKYKICFEGMSLSKYYRDNISSFVNLFDDTTDTLNYLKQKKYKLIIASNGYEDLQMKKINSKLDTNLFDDIFISEQCGCHKPDIQFFKEVVRMVSVSASQIMFIGDNFANDVMGPLNAGMKSIWITDKSVETNYHGLKINRLAELKKYL